MARIRSEAWCPRSLKVQARKPRDVPADCVAFVRERMGREWR